MLLLYSTLSGSGMVDDSNPWALPTAIKFHACSVKTGLRATTLWTVGRFIVGGSEVTPLASDL
jgi:hypothetical protein